MYRQHKVSQLTKYKWLYRWFRSKIMLGQFFPFVFRFLTYLLSCILFLFALRYFVNYAPLLRAVCKFRYSLLSRPFFSPGYVSISVTALVEVDFFPRWPWPPTLSSSAFGKQLRFHRFSLISFCSRLKVVFLWAENDPFWATRGNTWPIRPSSPQNHSLPKSCQEVPEPGMQAAVNTITFQLQQEPLRGGTLSNAWPGQGKPRQLGETNYVI